MQFTEQQISAVARSMSDRASLACEVDKEDNWKVYGVQYLEEAKSALEVLSAAAPQVVADERKLPPLPQYFPDIVNIRADEELRAQDYATQYARAALQAAPVHAQEPVAYTAGSHDIFELIREWAHKPEGERYEAARKIIGYVNSTYTAGVSDGKFLGATSAPAQPVAVPDCGACPGDGTICPKSCKLAEDSPPIAAPAAQGDKK